MMREEQEKKAEMCINALDFTKDWTTWMETLRDGIVTAQSIGISDEEIKDMAVRLGDFLAEKVCPATKEEELVKEVWTTATPDERKVLASIFFRMLS